MREEFSIRSWDLKGELQIYSYTSLWDIHESTIEVMRIKDMITT